MTAPSSVRGRGWPLVILAGLVMLGLLVVLLPLSEIFADQNAQIADAQAQMSAYRAEIAARPRLTAELADRERQATQAAALLSDSNTALAAASMQNLVKDMVERHSGQVRSAQTLGTSAANGLEKIQVQYELSIPLGSLKSVTYDLESGAPYLFLDEVEVRPETYAADNAGAPTNLHVTWTVHGYRRMAAP